MSKDSFIDEEFPPNEFSLMGKSKEGKFLDPVEARHKVIKESEVEWKRISDIFAKPVIYEDTINMNPIKYGRVTLNYFYAVLTSLASQYPSIFTKIILTKDYNPEGKYEVRLYIDGEFKTITIDDHFPCIKGTNVNYFTRPSNFEMWPLLIEKAWAKVNGGYLNILNLWAGDFFKALTGFTYDELIHQEVSQEDLFNKISDIKNKNGLAFTFSSDNKEIEPKGLFVFHAYIIEDFEKIEIEKDKYLCLLKLQDPEKESNWNGDYSPKSTLWNDDLKSKIAKKELQEGEFWISLEDFHKYFIRTDVCYMLNDGFSKIFTFEKDQLSKPKVFNLFVEEDGIISISILEKNWKFHRELRNISHPTSLILAEYDPANNAIKNICSNYESNEDLELTSNLKKGFYLVWAYKIKDPKESIEIDNAYVKFCTLTKSSVELVGEDSNFDLVRNMIYQYVKEQNKDKIKDDDFFYDVSNSFDKSGIGYELVINPFENIHQIWKVDSSGTHGFLILPPHETQNVDVTIGYKDYQIILGIKRYKFGKHCLNLGIEATVFTNSQDPPKVEPKPSFDNFFSKDEKKLKPINENPTFSSEEIKKVETYPTLNHWELFLEKNKDKYPLIVEELKKLEPLTEEKFDLNIFEKNGNLYIGEADYGIRFGRGAYCFNNTGTCYIGYWDKGLQFVKGKVFDKNNKLVFEGEYKRGLREGKGVYNYEGGEKYDGMFVNGLREGKGVFTWSDGTRWDGFFKNDEFNGEGTVYEGDKQYKATYKNGDLVEN